MASSLTQILDLEQLDNNLFRSQYHRENFRKTLFGGQVLSQALIAAFHTVGNRMPHSLHAYFLRAGSSEAPVIYDIESVRDGKSLASRRAVARQFGRPIFNMSASFHSREDGFTHQVPFPKNVPLPEELLANNKQATKGTHNIPSSKISGKQAPCPFELLPVDHNLFTDREPRPAHGLYWLKTSESIPDDPIYHYCALAFASDFGLLATAVLPHEATLFDDNIFAASIDHAMWFHSDNFRSDEWLLCQTQSPWAGNARGFALSHLFTMEGELVASATQEGLIRPI